MLQTCIIGNGVISLLWQLWCHCNPDNDKFSSLFNTTVVAIFPNVCLWQRSLCSNLAGIDPEKLYRGTFMCQYGLCCCIVWPSFLFECFVKIWATCKNFLGKWFTAPPSRKLPVRLWSTPILFNENEAFDTSVHTVYSDRPMPNYEGTFFLASCSEQDCKQYA